MNNSLNITTGSSAGRPLSAQYRCATFARMNSKSTAASIWRSRWSFGTSSSSVTISSSCCVGMGVFSITPLKTKIPHLARVCQQSEAMSNKWTSPFRLRVARRDIGGTCRTGGQRGRANPRRSRSRSRNHIVQRARPERARPSRYDARPPAAAAPQRCRAHTSTRQPSSTSTIAPYSFGSARSCLPALIHQKCRMPNAAIA
ncbi:putative transposase [Burkholderia mallei]|nr:putative transposase [Burkholderia mallei]